MKECRTCNGEGVRVAASTTYRELVGQQSFCLDCMGTGKAPTDEN